MMRGQERRHFWFLLRASVMLAAIVALPSASGARPPAHPRPSITRSKLPLLRLSEAEPVAASARSRTKLGRGSLLPMGESQGIVTALTALINGTLAVGAVASAPITYGSIAPPIATPDAALQSAFGFSGPMSEAQAVDPGLSALIDGITWGSTDGVGISATGAVLSVSGALPEGSQAGCGDDQTAMRLQAGGEFWNSRAASAAPAQIPQGALTAGALAKANSLGRNPTDPTLGPSGDRSNLPALGSAGGWCRPPPVLFSKSSPLASRSVLIPFVTLLVGIVVFWLSRGIKMPGNPAQSIGPSYRLRTNPERRSRAASA